MKCGLIWARRKLSCACTVFAVFLTLEITEIILFAGFFMTGAGQSAGATVVKIGGYAGVVTALVAWTPRPRWW